MKTTYLLPLSSRADAETKASALNRQFGKAFDVRREGSDWFVVPADDRGYDSIGTFVTRYGVHP